MSPFSLKIHDLPGSKLETVVEDIAREFELGGETLQLYALTMIVCERYDYSKERRVACIVSERTPTPHRCCVTAELPHAGADAHSPTC